MTVRVYPGLPDLLDVAAAQAAPSHQFLRRAWYAASAESPVTVIATRGDGSLLAAIPTIPVGPALIGARGVAGGYWPFRSVHLAPQATNAELHALFTETDGAAGFGPAWRIGPIYASDPATDRIKCAAARAGWTVLTRRLGRTFLFDAGDEAGWPRRSTRRRLTNYERQLAQHGAVEVRHIAGDAWSPEILALLGRIEEASWVGLRTDRSGAKFIDPAKRAGWNRAVVDPLLAECLSASILMVGGEPAAFSFDLRSGEMQYSIASSYDERFAAYRPGKIITAHQLDFARAQGVRQIDLGAGDSGYKREMGAVPGPEILDLLIVRNRPAAALLKWRWGHESEKARHAYLEASHVRDAGRGSHDRRLESLLALGAIAAAAATLVE